MVRHMDPKTLLNKLRAGRNDADIAAELKVHRTTAMRIRKGTIQPNLRTWNRMQKLAKAKGIAI